MCIYKRSAAEFLGTFVLVLFACGTAAFTGGSLVATSLAFGLVIVAMAYAIGPVSGCHINPAVSLAKLLNKELSLYEFVMYVCSQILGAIAGAATLGLIMRDQNNAWFATLGANAAPIGDLGILVACIAETILTFVFVFVIMMVTTKPEYSKKAGMIIGATLTLVHLLGINITGTSVNPARSIGPAILQAINGSIEPLKQIWIFIVFPLVGAALAYFAFKFFAGKCCSKDGDKEEAKTE